MDKRFINTKELAQYLGISPETIRSWVWLKKVPYTKVGRLVKFDLLKIDVWLKKNSIEAHSVY